MVTALVLFASQGDGRVVEFVVDGKRYTTGTTTQSVLHTHPTGERVPAAHDPKIPPTRRWWPVCWEFAFLHTEDPLCL